jgi:predicted Rossmann fold nucleotide-binding protein DprA/Smf involved in DNA uptake
MKCGAFSATALAKARRGAPPNPTGHRKGATAKPHPNKARAADAEAQIIALLQMKPMGPAAIAEATGAKAATVSERLRRMKDKGAVERSADGWRAVEAESVALSP